MIFKQERERVMRFCRRECVHKLQRLTGTIPVFHQLPTANHGAMIAENDFDFKVVFSNHGAVVRSWELMKYRDGTGKPLELVNTFAATKTHYPFSLLFENHSPSADLNQALWVAHLTSDGLGIDFEYSNGRSASRKSVRFLKNSYLTQVTSEVTENGSPL